MKWFQLILCVPLVAACVNDRNSRSERTSDDRSTEPVAPAAVQRSGTGVLARPNLGPEWVWAGQALPSGDPATSVLLVEKIAPAEVNASSPYEYTIRVTNIAPAMHLADVTVTDRLAESGYDFQSANPAAERSGNTLRWNIGHLGAGETKTVTVRGVAKATGRLIGCASATYTPLVCVATDVVSARLELSKFAPAEVVPCDDIPLRFVVKNPGSGSAANVKITDQLPDGWTVNGRNTITLDAGTLKGGESREFTAVAKATKTGEFVNKATATADGGLTAEASAPTAVRKPRLEITKKASIENQILGRDTTFTIVVANKGDAAARDVVLSDTLTGAERISAVSDGGTASGGTVSWRLGNLAPGASRTVTVTASRATDGTISNTATASGYCADSVSATATTAYRGIPAVLLEVVDDIDPVPLGGTTTYTIMVTNQGTASDSEIVIRCEFEDTVEFVSAGGVTAGTRSGSVVTFAPLSTLAPKHEAKWTVSVRGVKVGDARFKVALNTKETGRSVDETEATRIFE